MSFAPHCQFRRVYQCIKQTYLHVWYPLFQAQGKLMFMRNDVLQILKIAANKEVNEPRIPLG
jgi:hypothetical protein